MKTIIVYTSKTGTTEKCVNILKQALKDAAVIDLNQTEPALAEYDLVIIGSPIRVGKIDAKIKVFINQNKELLKTKKTAYFICCGFEKDTERYFKTNIPDDLLKMAVIYCSFGGEMDLAKQKGIDKMIVRLVKMSKEGKKDIKINEKKIKLFIQKISQDGR